MNHFDLVPRADLPRSSFNLSFSALTTFNAGYLVPVFAKEIYPGDTFTVDQSSIVRFTNSLIAPMMDNLEVKVEWFFVPHRLVYDKFENMMGQQEDPDDSIDYLSPTLEIKNDPLETVDEGRVSNAMPVESTVLDYLGVPCANEASYDVKFTLYKLRSYWKIYQDWYKDQNLAYSQKKWLFMDDHTTGDVTRDTVNAIFGRGECNVVISGKNNIGGDSADADGVNMLRNFKAMFRLARRAKRHDYFSSLTAFPQKGPGVELPLGTSAPVSFTMAGGVANTNIPVWFKSGSSTATTIADDSLFAAGQVVGDRQITAVADLSEASSATIASLRLAVNLQRFYEMQNLGGSRYIEQVRSFFGVVSPDARLQRSEYLGGWSTPFAVETVAQTSETTDKSSQGNLAAFGLSSSVNNAFTRSFTEHGTLMALCSIVSRPTYQQGLSREDCRFGRLDFYYPVFAHLSEQAVLNKEIYVSSEENNEKVFGYQERFAELRFYPNTVSGQMRSTHPLSLDVWHLGLDFANLPTLNQDFIEEHAPVDRILDVPSESGADQFVANFYFDIRGARVMPVYGVPSLSDHF